MPWGFSRISCSSRLFFLNKLKHYASATITTRPAPTHKSRLGHVVSPLVTTEERCRYSAYLAGVRKRGCVGDGDNTVWPHILQKRVQLQTQKPRSGHPRWTNILRLHTYLISLPLLAIASFFPTHSSSHHIIPPPQLPLFIFSDFSIKKTPILILWETKGQSRNSRSSQWSWNWCDGMKDRPAQTALRQKGKS